MTTLRDPRKALRIVVGTAHPTLFGQSSGSPVDCPFSAGGARQLVGGRPSRGMEKFEETGESDRCGERIITTRKWNGDRRSFFAFFIY